MDSNHRRRKPADLQSAPFGHSGICPFTICVSIMRAEDGAQTRDPQLGRLMLYQLSYPHLYLCGQRWIRTTEGVSQQIYSLPHLATLVFALQLLKQQLLISLFSIAMQRYNYFFNLQVKSIIFIAVIAHSSPLFPNFPPALSSACSMLLVVIRP